jgi:hypothetical protein
MGIASSCMTSAEQLLRARLAAEHHLVAERADVVDPRRDERARELLVDRQLRMFSKASKNQSGRRALRRVEIVRADTAPSTRISATHRYTSRTINTR